MKKSQNLSFPHWLSTGFFQAVHRSAGLPPVKIRYFEKFQFFNILIEKNEKSLKSKILLQNCFTGVSAKTVYI